MTSPSTTARSNYAGFGRRNDSARRRRYLPGRPRGQLYVPRGETREDKGIPVWRLRCVTSVPQRPNAEISSITSNYHSRDPYVSGVRERTRGGDDDFRAICAGRGRGAGSFRGIPATAVCDRSMHGRGPGRIRRGCRRRRTSPGSRRSSAGLQPANSCSRRRTQTNAACATAGRPSRHRVFVEYPKHIKLWGVGAGAGLAGGVTLHRRVLVPRQPAAASCRRAELLLAVAGAGNQLTGTDRAPPARCRTARRCQGYPQGRDAPVLATATKVFGPSCARARWWRLAEGRLYAPRSCRATSSLRDRGVTCRSPGSDASPAYNSTSCRLLRDAQFMGLPPRGPDRFRERARWRHGDAASSRSRTTVSGVGPTFNAGSKR
jgi:hypothetical protein